MLGDGVGHAFGGVSGESGAQEVVGVGGVAVGAGGADRSSAVAAGGEDVAGAFEQDRAVPVQQNPDAIVGHLADITDALARRTAR